MLPVPVIDIEPLVHGLGDVTCAARAIDAACREAGFFYVVGHGVDPELLIRLDELSRRFFALPEDEKAEISMARGGRAWRGWFPVGGELTSGSPDMKEGVYFGAELPPDHARVMSRTPLHGANLFPRRPPELREVVLAYMEEMTRLGQAVLAGAAIGLGLGPTWFVDHLTSDPLTLFRIFHYPPSGIDGPWGVGEHTDYGLLTILAQDANRGLQVRSPSGWVDADPVPGSFVCNLGDMLERLTGGLYRSTPHRVRNASTADRLSFPFFLDPSWSAVVERLPIVARPPDDEGAAQRWDQTSVHGFTGSYGDYILGKVAKVFPTLAAGAVVQSPSQSPSG
ncbi:MAG: isopenicillin N synthase family oxygenase [Actinomycetota bacterium]|nr:isopenicillin N synthase family oxygenase [Actinomycetota bacterium]